jgi:hypothetical protein
VRGRDGKNCGREGERRYLINLGENQKWGNWGGDAGEGGFIRTDYLDLADLDDICAKMIRAPCVYWMAGDPLTWPCLVLEFWWGLVGIIPTKP